ncbi:MAG: hypothetical protein ACLPJH_04200 [Myxococcaceae bacterium]
MRFAALLAVLLSGTPAAVAAQTTTPPPELAVVPFTGDSAPEGSLPYVQQHVIHWVRRWGQPCDDPKEVEARLGPEGTRRLYAAKGPYSAVLTGSLTVLPGQWTLVLTVTGLKDGTRWTTATVTAPSLVELLTALTDTARDLAQAVSRGSGRPTLNYVPPTRKYSTAAFISGGALIATGAVFFILSGVEDGKLSNKATSLPDAVSARNAANTYAIVGYSLTAVGAASLVLGLLLFHPGATPPAPALSLSVDPARGMVLVGGRLP